MTEFNPIIKMIHQKSRFELSQVEMKNNDSQISRFFQFFYLYFLRPHLSAHTRLIVVARRRTWWAIRHEFVIEFICHWRRTISNPWNHTLRYKLMHGNAKNTFRFNFFVSCFCLQIVKIKAKRRNWRQFVCCLLFSMSSKFHIDLVN